MKNVLKMLLFSCFAVIYGCSETATTEPTVTDKGYYPLTDGSSWTYEETEDNKVSTYTRKISGTAMFNGKAYLREISVFENSMDTNYIRRSNDTVFNLDDSGQGEDIGFIERKGATWGKTEVMGPYTSTQAFSTVDKGFSKTVDGKAHNDVLHVHGDITMTDGSEQETFSIDVYMSKNIGDIAFTSPGTSTILKSYIIK